MMKIAKFPPIGAAYLQGLANWGNVYVKMICRNEEIGIGSV
ncbi:MAG: hypothetical protein PWP24_1885 [Clostridiales bacterium]|nr:hypothetical protein [Clostridiales bacterium]